MLVRRSREWIRLTPRGQPTSGSRGSGGTFRLHSHLAEMPRRPDTALFWPLWGARHRTQGVTHPSDASTTGQRSSALALVNSVRKSIRTEKVPAAPHATPSVLTSLILSSQRRRLIITCRCWGRSPEGPMRRGLSAYSPPSIEKPNQNTPLKAESNGLGDTVMLSTKTMGNVGPRSKHSLARRGGRNYSGCRETCATG